MAVAPKSRRFLLTASMLRVLAALSFSAVVASSAPARADVSSWFYAGAGPSRVNADGEEQNQASLQLETGLGTPPSHTFIFGGMFKNHTHFGLGPDFGVAARGATHGFVNGGWGIAIDAGPYIRWWGKGSEGWAGNLVFGAPWGFTLSAGGSTGNRDAQALHVTIGIDLARLTVYRRTGDQWWKNPFPAYRPEEQASLSF